MTYFKVFERMKKLLTRTSAHNTHEAKVRTGGVKFHFNNLGCAFFLWALIVPSVEIKAQDSEDVDTIYFNKKLELCEKKSHHYFRIAKFEGPIYVMRDYYRNGKPQYFGQWLLKDSSETDIRFQNKTSEHRAIGDGKLHYSNGKIKVEFQFIPLGKCCDTTQGCQIRLKTYKKSGMPWFAWQGDVKRMEGMGYYYDPESGGISTTVEIRNGKYNGKVVRFYSDKSVYSVSEYVDGKKHGLSTVYYFYPDQPKLEKLYDNGKLVSKRKFAKQEVNSPTP